MGTRFALGIGHLLSNLNVCLRAIQFGVEEDKRRSFVRRLVEANRGLDEGIKERKVLALAQLGEVVEDLAAMQGTRIVVGGEDTQQAQMRIEVLAHLLD